MPRPDRKPATERARAHDDLVHSLETITHDLWELRKFAYAQEKVNYEDRLVDVDLARSVIAYVEKAVDQLHAVRRLVAVDAYDTRRAADIETGGPHRG